jgi:WD40 repeat protein
VTEVGNELDVVLAADISADHKQIALGGPQKMVRVYSTETGQLLFEKSKHTDWVLSIEFSPDGVLLATSDRSGGLLVWESQSGNEYLTLAGHTGAVTAVSWRADSNVLASASEDGTVRLWELENGTAIKNWNAKSAVLSAEIARDGKIVTCGRDQITRIWDQEGKQLVETKPIGEVAVSAAFCDETSRALAASWAGVVQVYKADDASVLGSIVTNPPKLEERLTLAQQAVKHKSAAQAPLADAVQKAEAAHAAAQSTLASVQKEAQAAQAEISKLAAEVKQITDSQAATEAERQKLASTLAQEQEARPIVA